MAQPIPQDLSHLMAVNVEYSVLICLGNTCSCAVNPAGFTAHVRRKHKVPKEVWEQVEQYIQECAFEEYNYASVQLPVDGLAPQPVIPTVDGFVCKECLYKTSDRSNIRKHANKTHNKKRAADKDLFDTVKLQSWFWTGKERYWVVDESQQAQQEPQQERQDCRATIRDVGEESDDLEADTSSGDSSGSGSDNSDDELDQEIKDWEAGARERRLQAWKNVPAVELDAWLHYTRWHEVLSKSKHNIVKTHQFARAPDPDEADLQRVLRAWNRILERCLDTLAATDQKDALKWWASPKNEAVSQRPFELPQTAKSIDKYSAMWERLICYMMRTAPVEHWEDETGE
jgi:hypothetical protein